MDLNETLIAMHKVYADNPVTAVRGQAFITLLHNYIAEDLSARIGKTARRSGFGVVKEATLYGSHKSKNVDVSLIAPMNGPLLTVGVRSQMSSVSKNVLNYYEGIIGECISLQERFPMATAGYLYLHPLKSIKTGLELEAIDHTRYAKMYAAITGRSGQGWKSLRGIYDQFAYMIVDFAKDPPELRDDIVQAAVPNIDLGIATLVDRLVATTSERNLFLNVFG